VHTDSNKAWLQTKDGGTLPASHAIQELDFKTANTNAQNLIATALSQ